MLASTSAAVVGVGLAGIAYCTFKLVTDRLYKRDPKKYILRRIQEDVQDSFMASLQESISRTHQTPELPETEEEKKQLVFSLLTNSLMRAVAVPVVSSLATLLAVLYAATIEAVMGEYNLTIEEAVRRRLADDVVELVAATDAYAAVESVARESLESYLRANFLTITPPSALLSSVYHIVSTDVYQKLITKCCELVLAKARTADPSSVAHFVHNHVGAYLSGESALSATIKMATEVQDAVADDIRLLIPSSAGVELAFYTKPFLAIAYGAYKVPYYEDLVASCVAFVADSRKSPAPAEKTTSGNGPLDDKAP